MRNGTDRGLRSTAGSTGLLYVVQHGLGPQMCTAPLALPVARFERSCVCSLRRASPVPCLPCQILVSPVVLGWYSFCGAGRVAAEL